MLRIPQGLIFCIFLIFWLHVMKKQMDKAVRGRHFLFMPDGVIT